MTTVTLQFSEDRYSRFLTSIKKQYSHPLISSSFFNKETFEEFMYIAKFDRSNYRVTFYFYSDEGLTITPHTLDFYVYFHSFDFSFNFSLPRYSSHVISVCSAPTP